MKSIDTETVKCSRCGVELDVPVYQDNEKTKYGMKYCHQCGAKLHDETIQLSDLKEALKLIREQKADNAKQREQIAEAKLLLKAVISDIYEVCSCNNRGCSICENKRETCDYDDRFTWRHKAAVLKLIGETNEEPRTFTETE